jgi:hypothetical protein
VDVHGPRGKLIVGGIASGAVLVMVIAVVWASYGPGGGPRDPESLRKAYAGSVFRTEVAWHLVDGETSRPAAHWYAPIPFKPTDRRRAIFGSRDRAPVYWRMSDGTIEPLLILSAESPSGVQIGGRASGTGVAVHASGFILTTRNSAAPWTRPYEWSAEAVPGLLIDSQSQEIEILDRAPANWVPQNARVALTSVVPLELLAGAPLPVVKPVWEGRIDTFRVSRPSAGWFDASMASTGDRPLAVAKLRTAIETRAVPLPVSDPALGAAQHLLILSFAAGAANPSVRVSECQVLKAETSGPAGSEFPALIGAAFRAEDSGSAVFDRRGRFIGLLLASQRSGQPVLEVVPIRYGRELLQTSRGQ